MSSSPDSTIYVVDDESNLRDALRLLFKSVGQAVETFSSAQEFLDSYDPNRPGCLVLDVRMPGMCGPELQEKLRTAKVAPPIIFITGHGDVPTTVRTMKAGAIDVIEKPFNNQTLLDRVQQALQLDLKNRQEQSERDKITSRLDLLTPRETEVMHQIVQGKMNKIIASDLGVSTRTVEIHRARIMTKMQTRSLPELVQMVLLVQHGQNNA